MHVLVLAVAVTAAALGAFASTRALLAIFAISRLSRTGDRRRRWRRRAEVGAQGHRPRLHRQVWLARAVGRWRWWSGGLRIDTGLS